MTGGRECQDLLLSVKKQSTPISENDRCVRDKGLLDPKLVYSHRPQKGMGKVIKENFFGAGNTSISPGMFGRCYTLTPNN